MTQAVDLSLARIEEAARVIDPVFRNSPQIEEEELSVALGKRVLVKVETINPVRSFKGRGADFKARFLDPKQEVVCASAGNFGQAVAYAGRSRGIPVTVFVPEDINPAKLARMRGFGAQVEVGGADGDEAKRNARRHAEAAPGRMFLEDGEDAAISEGAGTIGKELLEAGAIDTAVIPIGDGALIAGIALWLRAHSKATRIIGVCAAGAPAMAESWRAGKVMTVRPGSIADGLAVGTPIARSVERLRVLVDDMVLIEDGAMVEAMRLAARTLGLILEPSGAAGLAAIAAHKIPGDRVATVLTGGNINPALAMELPQAWR